VGGGGDNFLLYLSSSWVKRSLHTENQPRLHGSAIQVSVVVGWVLFNYVMM
jgi:hypothetical protein